MPQEPRLQLNGLDALDGRELAATIGADDLELITAEDEVSATGAHPEPLTLVALVVVTPTAIKGLAAWLMKKRHKEVIEIEAELELPDGTKSKRKLRFELSQSESDADVIQAIGKALELDPQLVAQALGGPVGA